MANLTTITLSASGSVTSSGQFSTIDATFGTAGTSNVVVMSVQGISGGTALIATGTLALSGTSNVALTGTGNVAVVGTTNVAIVSSITQNTAVVNTATVTIASITGTSNVAITGTGSILVVGTTNVAVVSAVTTATQNVAVVSGTISFSGGTVSLTGTTNVVSVSGTVPVSGTVALSGTSNVTVVNANANGQATMANSAPVTIASNQSGVPLGTQTSGGASMSVLVSATGLNGTAVKATQGTLYGVQVFNNSATIGYLKFYNATSAPTSSSITATSIVPVKTFLIPSGTAGAGAVYSDIGTNFSTGIVYVLTGGIVNSDTTGVAATTMVINVTYA